MSRAPAATASCSCAAVATTATCTGATLTDVAGSLYRSSVALLPAPVPAPASGGSFRTGRSCNSRTRVAQQAQARIRSTAADSIDCEESAGHVDCPQTVVAALNAALERLRVLCGRAGLAAAGGRELCVHVCDCALMPPAGGAASEYCACSSSGGARGGWWDS
jgi:hypothetical protein